MNNDVIMGILVHEFWFALEYINVQYVASRGLIG